MPLPWKVEKYNASEPVNIGSSQEISIIKLAATIANIINFKGKMVLDDLKPDGQPRRALDVRKAQKEFDFYSNVDLNFGLKKTIDWYNIYK